MNAAAVMSSKGIDCPVFSIMTTPWQTDNIINFPQNILDSLSKDIDSVGIHVKSSLHLSAVGDVLDLAKLN